MVTVYCMSKEMQQYNPVVLQNFDTDNKNVYCIVFAQLIFILLGDDNHTPKLILLCVDWLQTANEHLFAITTPHSTI